MACHWKNCSDVASMRVQQAQKYAWKKTLCSTATHLTEQGNEHSAEITCSQLLLVSHSK